MTVVEEGDEGDGQDPVYEDPESAEVVERRTPTRPAPPPPGEMTDLVAAQGRIKDLEAEVKKADETKKATDEEIARLRAEVARANRIANEAVAAAGDTPPAGGPTAELPRQAINANQLVVLKDFNGDDGEDIEILIAQVERGVKAFGWTEEQTASMVHTKLLSKAARWLQSAIKSAEPMDDNLFRWTNQGRVRGLKANLLLRFKEGLNERGAVEAILNLNQHAGESVDEFYDRVVLAMDRKNYNVEDKETPAYRNRLKEDIFIFFGAGLRSELRIQALGGPTQPRTATNLLKAARNAELERKKQKTPKQLLGMAQAAAEEEAEEKEAAAGPSLDDLASQVDAIRRQMRGGPSSGCFGCNSQDHYVAQCPRRARRLGPARGRGRPSPASSSSAKTKPRAPPPRRGAFRPRGGKTGWSFMAISNDSNAEPIEFDADDDWVNGLVQDLGAEDPASGRDEADEDKDEHDPNAH